MGYALASGIFWSLTYLLIIKRNYQDKACGMPLAALCANISWEFIFSFIYPHASIQRLIDVAWFLLDAILVGQYLWYERKRRVASTSNAWFYGVFFSTLVVSFCLILFVTQEFENWQGYYSAFGQNLLMSILFVRLLNERREIAGQSLYIALGKLLGTFFASLIVLRGLADSALMLFLAGAILFYDVAYVVLLYRRTRLLGLHPWRRW